MKRLLVAGLAGVLAVCAGLYAAKDKPADTRTVPQLVKALGHDVLNHRTAAAKALGAKGPKALPAILKALKDKRPNVRRGATEALGAMGKNAKDAVGALVKALKDKSTWVRDGAAEALGRIGPAAKAAAKALAETVRDKDVWLREVAMRALTSVTKDKDIILPAAIAVLKFRDTGWAARRHALGALRQHGKDHKAAIPALLYVLQNPAQGMWDGTSQTVTLLIGLGATDKAKAILVKSLTAECREIRRKAVAGLGIIGKDAKDTVGAIKAMLAKEKDRRARTAAQAALKQIEGKKQEDKK